MQKDKALSNTETQETAQLLSESLKGKSGRQYWKSLEQLADVPEFKQWVDDEFPHRRSLANLDRRDFIKFMGAGLMLAGLASSGCRKLPEDRLVPFVAGPEDRVPGVPTYYASIATISGVSVGVKVKTTEGRPIKLDGNPHHPASLGALDARTQARVLDLYDPDRLQLAKRGPEPASWSQFLKEARERLSDADANSGAGVAIITQSVGSPSYLKVISSFIQKYPAAKWVQHEAVGHRNSADGSLLAFSERVDTHYQFATTDVVLSIDSDVISEGSAAVRYQRDLMSRRDMTSGATSMNRIYAVESSPTTVGVVADHRLPLRASDMFGFAKALAGKLGVQGAGSSALLAGIDEIWLNAVAKDLTAHAGRSVVVVGDHLPASVHALVQAINGHLGNFGKTVIHTAQVVQSSGTPDSDLTSLVASMNSGQVKSLFILGGNPVYDAPVDLEFGLALKKVPFSAHLSMHDDETGDLCKWQLPLSHFLECWGDGRAYDGTIGIQQPTILPLYDSRSEIELLDALVGNARESREIVESFFISNLGRNMSGAMDFKALWRDSLASGVVAHSKFPPKAMSVVPRLVSIIQQEDTADGIELVIKPDPTIYDGRFANNGWLQELPKPLSNLTWDNTAQMSHSTALKLGVEIDKKYGFIPADRAADMVTITVDGHSVEAAVYVNHGMADDVVLVHLGYGRTKGGHVLLPLKNDSSTYGGGFDAYKLVKSGRNPWMVVNGAKFALAGKTYPLANAQFHNTIDMTQADSDRGILQETTLAGFLAMGPKEHKEQKSLYDTDQVSKTPIIGNLLDESAVDKSGWNDPKQYQWAMTIDLSLCTGCNACVVACQSENNIPTVGKYQVQRGREMHWIRIDRYYAGKGSESEWPVKNPDIRLQPVTCMQCENAPCEPVCPVAATTHSKEGLNQMIYNRCVGTRYCSNNCPYKVRRFNFLNYANHDDVPVKMLSQNPDVTVRGRGVMEKCTYCVQRINHARIDAKKKGEKIVDGGVKTSCQEACPSNAIVFGNSADKESSVAKSREDKRNYTVLDHELNTRPRTSYLTRVTNPNQEIEA